MGVCVVSFWRERGRVNDSRTCIITQFSVVVKCINVSMPPITERCWALVITIEHNRAWKTSNISSGSV